MTGHPKRPKDADKLAKSIVDEPPQLLDEAMSRLR